jgi:hypothetical protein
VPTTNTPPSAKKEKSMWKRFMWFPPLGFRYHPPSGRTLPLTISVYKTQSAPTRATGCAALNGKDGWITAT